MICTFTATAQFDHRTFNSFCQCGQLLVGITLEWKIYIFTNVVVSIWELFTSWFKGFYTLKKINVIFLWSVYSCQMGIYPKSSFSMCDVATFYDEIAWQIIVIVTYFWRTFFMALSDLSFKCVKSSYTLYYCVNPLIESKWWMIVLSGPPSRMVTKHN